MATSDLIEAFTTLDDKELSYPRFAQFECTDTSHDHLVITKEQLSRFGPVIQFKELDIEQDPRKQGYETESYDLLVASNVSRILNSDEKNWVAYEICGLTLLILDPIGSSWGSRSCWSPEELQNVAETVGLPPYFHFVHFFRNVWLG